MDGPLGRFKLESQDREISSVCCLRSKMYSILYTNNKQESKLKGVPKNHVKKNMSFENYKNCLLNEKDEKTKFWRISSKKHQPKTFLQTKTSVSCFEDKSIYNFIFVGIMCLY